MASELLSDHFIGTVMKIDRDTRKLAVYIPRLMPSLYNGDVTEYKYPTNNGIKITNINSNISSTITKTNYMWIAAKDKDEPLPEIGSKVLVQFLDNNPNIGYWEKWNYSGDYNVIEDEKYSKCFTIKSDQRTIDINTEDELIINLPDSYSVTSKSQNKKKEIAIHENYNFYKAGTLENSISDLQKSMYFLEKTYYETFLNNIQKLNLFETSPVNINDWYSFTSVETDLETYRSTAIASIDNIDRTRYSLGDLNDIENEITNIKSTISGAISIAEINKAINNLIEFLKPYNKTVDVYLNDKYINLKETGIDRIRNTNNLLDASTEFNYINSVLIGLKDIYGLYSNYRTAFNSTDATVKEILHNTYELDLQTIDSYIRLLFNRIETTTTTSALNQFIINSKNAFPATSILTYRFSTNGFDYQYIEKDTGKLFTIFDENDYIVSNCSITDSFDDLNTYESFNMLSGWDNKIQCTPLITNNVVNPIVASKYDVVGWKTEDGVNISTNYYLTGSETLIPRFIGMYFVNGNNIYRLAIKNDDNLAYKISYIDLSTNVETEKSLTEINNIINEDSFPLNVKFILKYGDSYTNTIELEFNNNTLTNAKYLVSLVKSLVENIEDDYSNVLLQGNKILAINNLRNNITNDIVGDYNEYNTAITSFTPIYMYYIKASVLEPLIEYINIYNENDTYIDISLAGFEDLYSKYNSLSEDVKSNDILKESITIIANNSDKLESLHNLAINN